MHVSRSPTAGWTSAAATAESTPPDSAQMTLPSEPTVAAWASILLANYLCQSAALAQNTNLYFAGFERAEEFDPQFTLVGQGGWTGTDVNGNGIITNVFVNTTPQLPFGQQQAFIGYTRLTNSDGTLNVWRPLNFNPVAVGNAFSIDRP